VTRPLPLRTEQPPDDTAVVLRGGMMAVDDVRLAAERCFDPPIPNPGRAPGR
jgi:hypothetical protein